MSTSSVEVVRRAIEVDIRDQTVLSRLVSTVEARGDAVALRWRSGADWRTLSWLDYLEAAGRVAGGLQELGVGRGDRVLLVLRNRPEFHLADVASLLLGAVPVSTFVSSPPARLAALCAATDARVIATDDAGLAATAVARSSHLPAPPRVVVVDDPTGVSPAGVQSWADLAGAAGIDATAAAERARPEDLATIVFTSGTTGQPKGVLLTHANICWTTASLVRAFGAPLEEWPLLSYLPMAHIAERVASHYLHLDQGAEVATCPSPGLLAEYLAQVRPRLFVGVPKVWEHIHHRIKVAAASDPAGNARFEHAVQLGQRRLADRLAGRSPSPADARAWRDADREVLAVVRALIGLDRCEVAVTTAGPTPDPVVRFLLGLGLPLTELYGMTESCGPITWSPHDQRPGSNGPPIPGCEVRLAADGEILVRGGNVFLGYLDDTAATREVLDADDWLHTGDVGEWVGGGMHIVGRKKQLIITTAGEHAAPEALEAALRVGPLIDQVCVVGDNRPYLVALVTLDPEAVTRWAAGRGLGANVAALAGHPAVINEIGRRVGEVNSTLPKGEWIRRYRVLSDSWPPDSELLTATLKPRRRAIEARYAAEIVDLYT